MPQLEEMSREGLEHQLLVHQVRKSIADADAAEAQAEMLKKQAEVFPTVLRQATPSGAD